MKKLLILVTFLGLTVHFCDVQGSAQRSQKELNLELIKAAASRDIDLVKIRDLVDAGVDVNAAGKDGWTALMWAAFKGHRDVVRLLLQAGANVNATDNYGLTAIDMANNQEIRDFLMGYKEALTIIPSAQ